ncbi:MAG: T9SS type A sorting domain-containing protein [Ignavibacteriaceae bacterium]
MFKRLSILSLLLIVLFQFSGLAQFRSTDVSTDIQKDYRPSFDMTEALWDVQFNYDATAVTGAAGNAGAVYIEDLEEFWTSRWASNINHRWTSSGTLIEQFTVTGVTGVRAFTYDGTFVYAGQNTTTIAIIDPVTRMMVGSITAPQTVRYLTYDPTANGGAGGLWLGNFSTNLQLISMTGTVLTTHPYASLGVTSIYGAAWDGYSAGGPFLWLWGQGAGAGSPQWIVQIDPVTGLPTGVTHDVLTDIGVGNVSAIAGGLFISEGLVSGFATLGGLLQGTPDRLFGYELTPTGPPCPIDPASNPTPASGATGVSINPGNATWTNGAGATTIEVLFGEVGNLTQVYSGAPITSLAIPGPLEYATSYGWRVIGHNDTCQVAGPVWTFTTMDNPLLVAEIDTVYPQNVAFWTGSTDGANKTDGEVRGFNTEDGWFMFDISNIINNGTIIDSVHFYGYVNATNWPYWSATPLPGLNPLTATASELKTAIQANSATGVAYVFSNEASGFTTGAKMYSMGTSANDDMEAALSQGWFAMGMDSRDNSATYFINWDGWSQTNAPYLVVFYRWVIPVELTSFTAASVDNKVTLNWSTASEINNNGFEVERDMGNGFTAIGFVQGNGTTTEVQTYTFVDDNLAAGSYSYRLKQVDFDGTFEYSDVVEVDVLAPKEFALNQNFPNPFNPSTIITFSLATDSKVSLKVFDVLGQEVITIVNNNLSAGAHEYSFDASSFNSGVYFYRIEASGVNGQSFTSVKKMILTK